MRFGGLTIAAIGVLLIATAPVGSGAIIADFVDDYQPVSFPSGWSYQWNKAGAIGDASNYVDLLWDGTDRYDADGSDGLPDSVDGVSARYCYISQGHGHAAADADNSGTERYTIAGFTVDRSGPFSITDTNLTATKTNVTGSQNGLELRVLLNDTNKLTKTVAATESTSFDMDLGVLSSGDTIYVAVGPDGQDQRDNFTLDFSVTPEPTSALLLVLAGLLALGRRRTS